MIKSVWQIEPHAITMHFLYFSIGVGVLLHLLRGHRSSVHLAPDIPYVEDDHRDKQRYPRHDSKSKLRAAAVGYRKGRLRIGQRRHVAGVVVSEVAEETDDGDDGADACPPYSTAVFLLECSKSEADKHEHYAYQESREYPPHINEVDGIFVWYSHNVAFRINSISVRSQDYSGQRKEQNHKDQSVEDGFHANGIKELLSVVDGVHKIEGCVHTGKEEDGEADKQVFPARYGLKAVSRRPNGNDGRVTVKDISACHSELSSEKENADSNTNQHTADNSIDEEEGIVGAGSIKITLLATELIADGLKHEAEENSHPEPIGASERGGVKEGEGSEEGASEYHQGSECKLPFAAEGIHDKVFCHRTSGLKQEALTALNEKHEYEGPAEHCYEKPPIYL